MSKTKSKKTNKNKIQKLPGKKDLSNVKAIFESYGGFHDLETFRNETGLDDHDINDMQVMQLINEDMREQKRISDLNMNQLQSKAREVDSLRQARDAFSAQKTLLETNLETEKLKRQAYENSYNMPIVLNRYRVEPTYKIDPYNIYDTTRYLEKERLKNELKQELQEEKRRQQEDKKWKKQIEQFNKPPRTKSKSKSKKTKSKKTKNKKKN